MAIEQVIVASSGTAATAAAAAAGAGPAAVRRSEKPFVRSEDNGCNYDENRGFIVPPSKTCSASKGLLNGQSQGAPLSYASPCRKINNVPYGNGARLPEMGPIPEVSKENLSGGAKPMQPIAAAPNSSPAVTPSSSAEGGEASFSFEETLLILDWDDTVLPSTWVHMQGLRLDDASFVNDWQREQLDEVAAVCIETLRMAKELGTVVLVTNAERGWIELSCQKFMPTLYSSLEGIKVVSARTTYEGPQNPSPLDWKLRAFEAELVTFYGAETLTAGGRRKNVLSLGDSVNEREALLRSTSSLPNCRSKSLKFVERPELGQLMKQHALVTSCFNRVVDHDGNLDLVIRCT